MKPAYILEPEVPGGLGARTQMDRSVHPPRITHLHFVFDGWLGDQLVESFPCYLVTDALAQSFRAAGISGFEIGDADVETSDQFKEMYPSRELPVFKWLKIDGDSEEADLFMTLDHRLAVSRKVLDLVLASNPQGLDYREAN